MARMLSDDLAASAPVAFVSHESARIACWNLAGRGAESWPVGRRQLLSDSACVTRQPEFSRLAASIDLPAQGFSTTDVAAWDNIWRLVRLARTVTEFAGTYRPAVPPSTQAVFGRPLLATRDDMRAFLGTLPASAGVMRARRAIELGFDRAASPMETALALMLSLDVALGGFGLPLPMLNHPIVVGPERRNLSRQNLMEAGLAWDGARLTTEDEGDDYHPTWDAEKAADDNERQNSLVAMGYTVLCVCHPQVVDYSRLALLVRQIAHLLDVELVQPDDLRMIRRRKLHAALLAPLARRET